MDDTLQQRFAHHLREHRKQLGLSQERFAEELGFHRTYIGGLETAKRNPSLRTVQDLADRLGLDALGLLAPITPSPTKSAT